MKSLTLIGWGIVKLIDTFLLLWGWRLKSLTQIGWGIVKLVDTFLMAVEESHPDRVGNNSGGRHILVAMGMAVEVSPW